MSVDFNGTAVGYTVNGRSTYSFELPRDRATLPVKVASALAKADAAVAAEREVYGKDGNDHVGQRAANEKTGAAVDDVYDVAASTSRARREHHLEGFGYAAAKLSRALGEAERALQGMADHAQQAVNPSGVGFSREASKGAKTVVQLRFLVEQMAALPSVPALSEEV